MDELELTEAVRQLILESAPERLPEMEALWGKYSPTFAHASDESGFKMEGGAFGLIVFTPRTAAQVWLLGFAAWKALEAYCPYLFLRIPITPSTMSGDPDQVRAEKALNDDLRKVRELKKIENLVDFEWPATIFGPGPAPPATIRDRAIVDLIKIAMAFIFLHEVRHAMFRDDGDNPQDQVEEERECDRFAKDFLLQRFAEYCANSNDEQDAVLNKRMMGILLGAFVILEITPEAKRGGTDGHPSVALRFQRLVEGVADQGGEHMWIYLCSLLLGKLKEEGKLPPSNNFREPKHLFERLVALL